MSHTIVTYTVEQAEHENAALVRAVFEELAQTRPGRFGYAVFQLPDSRQFAHLYTDEGAAAGALQQAVGVPSVRGRGPGSPRATGHPHGARADRRLPHICGH